MCVCLCSPVAFDSTKALHPHPVSDLSYLMVPTTIPTWFSPPFFGFAMPTPRNTHW